MDRMVAHKNKTSPWVDRAGLRFLNFQAFCRVRISPAIPGEGGWGHEQHASERRIHDEEVVCKGQAASIASHGIVLF